MTTAPDDERESVVLSLPRFAAFLNISENEARALIAAERVPVIRISAWKFGIRIEDAEQLRASRAGGEAS